MVSVLLVSASVDWLLIAASVGASLTGVTVSVKLCLPTSVPSEAEAVIVAAPFQFAAGVSVRVVPETLMVMLDSSVIAE